MIKKQTKKLNKKLRLNGYLITKIEHIPAIAGERRMFFISCEGTRGTFLYEDEVLEMRENMARQSMILTAENGDVLFVDRSGGVKKYTKEEV